MSTIIKYSTLLLTLSALIAVNTMPTKFKECELASMFLRNGFSQYHSRFSICYAKSKNFVPKAVTPYLYNATTKAIFFFGMFPITTPFCGDSYLQSSSVCDISCKHTDDYKLENEVLCMKHVFAANLSEIVTGYMKRQEGILSDCMRTIFDVCDFIGPGGRTQNGEPIFLG